MNAANGRIARPVAGLGAPAAWLALALALTGCAGVVRRNDDDIGKDELHAIGLCRAYAQARNIGAVPVPKPFHGYLFKSLPRQIGSHIGGFALAAYPDHWGRSGVMTFIVDQDGKVYQRDLGRKTAAIAARLDEYAPDGDWTPVDDKGIADK